MTRIAAPLIAGFATLFAAGTAAAFPLDGTYYAECEGQGVGAQDSAQVRLAFPEVCFDGACCVLSNPTRLRGLPDQFLYDGLCTGEDGVEFEERIFFGEGPDLVSVVIVLRGLGMTLSSCLPEPPLEDA
jgi:hypothetical protein